MSVQTLAPPTPAAAPFVSHDGTARIERVTRGAFELGGADAIAVAASLGGVRALRIGGDSEGDVCIAAASTAERCVADRPVVVLTVRQSAWARLTADAAPRLATSFIGPRTPVMESAARLLSDLIDTRGRWSPLHDGLVAVALHEAAILAQGDPATDGFSPQVARAVRLIETALNRPLSLDDLAAAAGWSPFHFARRFKSETGESPSRYLRLRRVERAQALLSETSGALADIALATGFTSQSQMTTAFTTLLGVSPAKFRKSGAPARRLAPRPKVAV